MFALAELKHAVLHATLIELGEQGRAADRAQRAVSLRPQRAGTSEHNPLDGCGYVSRIATPQEVGGAPGLLSPVAGDAPFSHPIAPALRGRALRADSKTTRGGALCSEISHFARDYLAPSGRNLSGPPLRRAMPSDFTPVRMILALEREDGRPFTKA
jgi:hypothetical protein